MAATRSDDAIDVFNGIGQTYERAGALLSFGQDPLWRARLVASVEAGPGETVLDVATGTGLVARALRERYTCDVVGLDRSEDMLAAAVSKDGGIAYVRGRAERLPFPDGAFDHLTFTYLLRYVDDPAAVIRELARVVKPGGRIAALDFAVPRGGLLRALWHGYTKIGLPVIGRLISQKWASVGAFLNGSIERFNASYSDLDIERYWREAGLADVRTRRMTFGAATLMTASRAMDGAGSAGGAESAGASPGAAFYALRPGSWRDYWTLLHPPYTVWHLSYVLIGAALSPAPDPRVVAGALLAFFLAVGISAHSFDELRGRPLGTRIPAPILVGLGAIGLAGAVALGFGAASMLGPWFLALVAAGALLVVLYAFEVPLVHSDLGFALAWGGFPVVTAAAATGAPPLATALAATGAALLSLAQRRLSTPVRRIRRKSAAVEGVVRYRDGTSEPLDAARLVAAPEAALRIIWLAALALAAGSLIARWTGA